MSPRSLLLVAHPAQFQGLREQVLAHRYASVLTWKDHDCPLADALSMSVLGSSTSALGVSGNRGQ